MTPTFNVIDHGAAADGKTKCTEAIARAVEACSKAGGGRVLFPPGVYLTGPIQLASRLNLHVEEGAAVLFSRDFDDYPLVMTHYEGVQRVRCMSPLYGRELHDVSITGAGVFDGQGEAWRPVKRFKTTPQQWSELLASGGVVDEIGEVWWPTAAALAGREIVRRLEESGVPPRLEDYQPARDFLRPCLLELIQCTNVRLEGPVFRNSPAWNLHPVLCENIVIRNITALNPWYGQNTDGLDLDSCRTAWVCDSLFDVGDDAICLKSGRDEQGRKLGRPCENITIANCTVLRGHGGVTIGSEMSGGVRNVDVSNCIFRSTDIGLRFKSTRGRGGVVENIRISNVAMSDIRKDAISLDMFYTESSPEPASERTPVFRGIAIRNAVCHSARRAITIRGLPEMPIEEVAFENVRISSENGISITDARDISLVGVRVQVSKPPAIQCHNVTNLKMERCSGLGG
jgi:polygalacturonase